MIAYRTRRWLSTWSAIALALSAAVLASADDARAAEPVARILVDAAQLRSGPGGSYRRVYVATRGETFPVRGRSPTGYWLEVALPDGARAYVLGDLVEVGQPAEDDDAWSTVFAPPALLQASGEIAVTLGGLDDGGVVALRPSVLLAPELGVEVTALASVSGRGRVFACAAGPIVNPFPNSPVSPFVAIGGGFALADPNADSFVLDSGRSGALYGGGGLRVGFRHRFTLRIDARVWSFVEPDRHIEALEVSGGLTVFY